MWTWSLATSYLQRHLRTDLLGGFGPALAVTVFAGLATAAAWRPGTDANRRGLWEDHERAPSLSSSTPTVMNSSDRSMTNARPWMRMV